MMLCIAKQIFVMNIEIKQMEYISSSVHIDNIKKMVYFVGLE